MYVKKKGHPLIWYVYIIEIDISILVVIDESSNLVQLYWSLIIESYVEYNEFDNG